MSGVTEHAAMKAICGFCGFEGGTCESRGFERCGRCGRSTSLERRPGKRPDDNPAIPHRLGGSNAGERVSPPTADGVAAADLTRRTLAWAYGIEAWWTLAQAAAALGATEDAVRAALGELEGEGLIYRAVAVKDAYCITADGRDARCGRVEPDGGGKTP